MKKLIYTFILAVLCTPVFSQVPMLGEIRLFAGNFAPQGWAFCDGQLLNIDTNPELFSLIGTTYGGNGTTTFALPRLNGRVVIGTGQGPGLSNYVAGQTGGSANITFTQANLPSHSHSFSPPGTSEPGNSDSPAGTIAAMANHPIYHTSANSSMAAGGLNVDVEPAGGNQPQNNMQPYTAINYIIAVEGAFQIAADPYLGEIKLIAGSQIPSGWVAANGQLLTIIHHSALFDLLGTTHGGNGRSNFALPDLRGRVPIGRGQALNGANFPLGATGGQENQTLDITMLPSHTHNATGSYKVFSGIGNTDTPVGNYPAINPQRGNEFSTSQGSISTGTIITETTGSGQQFSNIQPFVAMQYIIAIQGIVPSMD